MNKYAFDVAIFATNEASAISECISSVDNACAGRAAHISVLLNGTTDNSIEILRRYQPQHAGITVYLFPIADKANAINHFLYSLREDADVYFGIDGHVQIGSDSLEAMRSALNREPRAYVASSIQISGRSAKSYAKQVLSGGTITGQLFALRKDFVDRLVNSGFRLPLQIYRGDPLLGSMAAHNLDAKGERWNNSHIIGVPSATFSIRPLSPFRPQDIRRQFHREIRQARGRMENAAIKSIIYSSGYAALPSNANAMLRNWLATNHPKPRSLREAFFTKLALRQLARSTDIEPAAPAMVFCSEAR